MLKEEIERLREQINHMIVSEDGCNEDLLRLSRELDILIIEFMRSKNKTTSHIYTSV